MKANAARNLEAAGLIPPEVSPVPGSKWRNRKSGSIAEVVSIDGAIVHLKLGARSTLKYLPHLVKHYAPMQEKADG